MKQKKNLKNELKKHQIQKNKYYYGKQNNKYLEQDKIH